MQDILLEYQDILLEYQGFPCGSEGKESAFSAGDPGLIPGLGRSPGGGNGNPPQYSCLENSMDRGAGRLQSMESHRIRHNLATITNANRRLRRLLWKMEWKTCLVSFSKPKKKKNLFPGSSWSVVILKRGGTGSLPKRKKSFPKKKPVSDPKSQEIRGCPRKKGGASQQWT